MSDPVVMGLGYEPALVVQFETHSLVQEQLSAGAAWCRNSLVQEQLGAGTAWRSRLLKSSGYRFKRNSSAVVVLCVCGVVLGGSLKVKIGRAHV